MKKLEPLREQVEKMAPVAEHMKKMLDDPPHAQLKNLEPFRDQIEQFNEITKLKDMAGGLSFADRLALDFAKSRPWEHRMLESFRPDLSHFDDMMKNIKPIAQQRSDGFRATVAREIQGMQKSLGPDKELLVYYYTGLEPIRVLNIATPDWETVVLNGVDENGNPSKIIASIQSVQFVCKIVDVPPQQKRVVGFSMPEQKEPPADTPTD